MLVKLALPDFAAVGPLVAGLSHQLSANAVLAGQMPGDVFVDDAARPTAALVQSPEGWFVAGDPGNTRFVAGLRDRVTSALDAGARDFVLDFGAAAWAAHAHELAPESTCITVARRHYVFSGLKSPTAQPPAGYRLEPLTPTLLDRCQVPDHVHGWISSNWGSVDAFVTRGFGAAAVRGSTVVSWSLADCVTAGRAEIGIHTAPEHRRRGLAAAVAATAVALALDRGLTDVGWHCNDDNVGSYRTAETVGFALERRYQYFAYRP